MNKLDIFLQKVKTYYKLFFTKNMMSYDKLYLCFEKLISKLGFKFKDLCEYRLTQIFDENNQPTESFYYSNYSLGPLTTYKPVDLETFTNNFNLEFVRSEKKHGIFTKKSSTKVLKFIGRSKVIINSPYMINLNFGDYLALSNDLIMIIPKHQYKDLFKRVK